jgi:hypothetical protein
VHGCFSFLLNLKNRVTIQRLSPNWEFIRQVTQHCHPVGILFVAKRSAEDEQDSLACLEPLAGQASRMTCYWKETSI